MGRKSTQQIDDELTFDLPVKSSIINSLNSTYVCEDNLWKIIAEAISIKNHIKSQKPKRICNRSRKSKYKMMERM